MIEELSTREVQTLATAFMTDLMEGLEHIDYDTLTEVIQEGLEDESTQRLMSVLLCIDPAQFSAWTEEVLSEPEPNQ